MSDQYSSGKKKEMITVIIFSVFSQDYKKKGKVDYVWDKWEVSLVSIWNITRTFRRKWLMCSKPILTK